MPKDTFFNLPEDKRALICEVALDEFAEYPFEQSSINRIVANAGIAKGSFYQYFEDKGDLFSYLSDLISQEKVSYLSPVLQNIGEIDFFTLIHDLFVSGVRFAYEHPRYAAIGNKLLANKETSIYKELKAENLPSSTAIIEPLVKQAVAKGDVREDIDIQLLSYFIATMNVSIVEYCSENQPDKMYDSIVETADAFMDILRNGIGKN